jgi:hypothetical protein
MNQLMNPNQQPPPDPREQLAQMMATQGAPPPGQPQMPPGGAPPDPAFLQMLMQLGQQGSTDRPMPPNVDIGQVPLPPDQQMNIPGYGGRR